ncbi:MAG: DMT family transporter [Actinomycetota bacterium]
MNHRTRASIGLTGAAFLFGATFVVIKEAVEVLPPLAFVGWRFLLGAAALFIFARPRGTQVWIDGTAAGVLLWAGYVTQTMGLAGTSASNSGLITGLYVVFTPLLAATVRRQRPAIATVGGATLSVVGLGLLTITAGFHLNSGDVLTVVCAVAFAAHIVLLSYLAPRHAVVPFTAVQLLVVAVLSLLASAIFEGFPLPSVSVLPALIGTGVVVSGGAFMMQVAAQRVLGPSRTAIILSAEPVFAAATAAIVLGERLSARGWLGAALIMIGVYVVLALSPPEQADLVAAEAVSEAH